MSDDEDGSTVKFRFRELATENEMLEPRQDSVGWSCEGDTDRKWNS